MIPDEQLIHGAQQGREAAAEQLFSRYQDRVFNYLLRMTCNRVTAEDATQETFLKAIKGLKTYREKGAFKSWLFKIAYREGIRALNKEKKHFWKRFLPGKETCDPVDTISSVSRTDEALMLKERQVSLETALEQLPPNERQVVILRTFEGLSFKEISEIMDCPLNTSLGRMHNAVKRLKNSVGREA